jgi:tetratricopeptide (TPR) repeat protein
MSAGNLIKKANQLKREGKLDEAIALYHQAVEINPHFAWTYYDLGDALVKKGNLDEAIACYSQGLKVNPNSAWLFYGLGDALAQQGDLEAAVEYLQKAIEIQPEIRGNIKLLGLYEDVCARLNNSRKVGDNSQVLRPAKKTIRSPVLPKDTLPDDHGQYVLHKYLNEEGHFDYDRFGAEASVMPMLVNLWGQGKYAVSDVLNSPLEDGLKTVFFVIKKLGLPKIFLSN